MNCIVAGQKFPNTSNHQENYRPLITFLLVAYNQEQFIEESVAGALAQTYSPLEIILSDDCSTDSTFKKIEAIVRNYKGPHTIIINRNTSNLGIGGHFNRCLELANGKFIVAAAGDDVSLPNRVMRLFQLWSASDSVRAIFSNLEKIKEDGASLGPMFNVPPRFARNLSDFKKNIACWVVGASFGFEKKIFTNFGPLNPAVRQEDGCLAFRAILEGRIEYLDEILVKYRHHDGNVSQSLDPARRLILQRNTHFMYKNWLSDATKACPIDHSLLWRLKWIVTKSLAGKIFFELPFLGYLYNFARIKGKNLFKFLSNPRVLP